MTTRIRQVILLLAVLCQAIALSTAADEIRLVELPAGSTFDLGADSQALGVLVPVTIKPELDRNVQPQVAWVRFGNQSDETLRRAFAAAWVAGDNAEELQSIRLAVTDYKAVNRAGTYEVALRLQSTNKPPSSQFLKLQVTHPSARLFGPLDTLIVERVYSFPPWVRDCPHISSSPLTFTEISRRSGVTGIQIQPLRNPVLGDVPVTGYLGFRVGEQGSNYGDHASASLVAGGNMSVAYEPEGNFPLGIVKGPLQVSANELSEPVPLNYEVRSRLARGYIFVFIAIGLVVSYLLKVKLQKDIRFEEARLKAVQTLAQAQGEFDRREDKTFRVSIEHQLDNLKSSVKGKDVEQLVRDKDALDKALSSALQELTTRKQMLQRQIDDLLVVTDNTWDVPNAPLEIIFEAKRRMADAIQLIGADNVFEAQKSYNFLAGDLAAKLHDAMISWHSDLSGRLKDLETATHGISTSVKSGLTHALEQTEPLIKGGATSTSNPAEMVQALRDLSIARKHAYDVLHDLRYALEAEASLAQRILAPSQDPTSTVANLLEKLTQLYVTLDKMLNDPQATAEVLPSQLRDLDDAWRVTVLAHAQAATRASVIQLLDNKDYIAAARAAMSSQSVEALSSDTPSAAPGFNWRPVPGLHSSPAIVTFHTFLGGIQPPQNWDILRLKSQKNLWWAKFVSSLTIGILLGAFGYNLFAPTFVGNFPDFMRIFSWAFGLDITVDTILKLK